MHPLALHYGFGDVLQWQKAVHEVSRLSLWQNIQSIHRRQSVPYLDEVEMIPISD